MYVNYIQFTVLFLSQVHLIHQ